MRGEYAGEANQVQARTGNERGEALQEFLPNRGQERRHHDMGGAVLIGALQLQHRLASTVALEPFVGNGRAGDIAAQLFERLALIGAATHPRVQALVPYSGKAVRISAQRLAGWCCSAGQRLQTEHFLPRARPKRDAIS